MAITKARSTEIAIPDTIASLITGALMPAIRLGLVFRKEDESCGLRNRMPDSEASRDS